MEEEIKIEGAPKEEIKTDFSTVEPTQSDPVARVEELWGTLPQVTTTPTWTPRTFREGLALDTSSDTIYYYDFTNNSWRSTLGLTADELAAINGADSPSASNVFITENDLKYFGDGNDGAVDLDGTNTYSFASKSGSTYTLTRDVYATTFQVQSGSTLETKSFRVYASTSITNAGTIHNDGNDGGDATIGTPGTGGAAIAVKSLGASGAGSTYGPNVDGGSVSNSWGGNGGDGGGGGNNGLGGTATAALTRPASPGFIHTPVDIDAGSLVVVTGGAGGGHGNIGSIGNNAAGGGGGGAGVVFLASPTITNTGTISAAGGAGGNGFYDSGSTGGAGGGGGGGGAIFLFYITLTAGTTSVAGGAGGTGAAPGGGNGATGSSGTVFSFSVI